VAADTTSQIERERMHILFNCLAWHRKGCLGQLWALERTAGVPETTTLPGLSCKAAATVLKRFTEVESATSTSPGPAPMIRAILSPTLCCASHQPCLFQLLMRSLPHSCCTTCQSNKKYFQGLTSPRKTWPRVRRFSGVADNSPAAHEVKLPSEEHQENCHPGSRYVLEDQTGF
jgi:hypothetical protein